ncbi:MAG: transporter, family, hexuronate transporter [Pseudomonadota bacterium]|nr:transporter, family, hexuronate transporter [Pseudomonadota bacterium]
MAAPALVAEFGIDNTEFGTITAAFLFCYGIGHLIAGPFIDRVGTRAAFKLAVIAWSIAGFLHAFGRGFFSFIACRALLGLTEAANFPAAVKAIAEWFPRRDRSMAVGILTVGPGLGALLAPPLLGGLIIVAGWRAAFIVPALAGFVWLWFWLRYYRSPARHPDITDAERALILADDPQQSSVTEPSSAWADVGRLLRHREVWGLLLSRISNDGAFYFFVSFLPLYLAQVQGFDLREIAAFAWVPFLAADVGALFGGWVGRQLMLRGWSLDAARKSVIWGGAVLVVLTLPAATSKSPAVALALIALAMFAIQAKASSLFALPADLYPSLQVGTVWGLFGAAGSFGAALFSFAAGWVSQHYAYAPVFVAVVVTQLLSAGFVSWLIPQVLARPRVAL